MSADGRALHDALYRLLHHRGIRDAFTRGDAAPLGLGEAEQRELGTIDLPELEASARAIARGLLGGNSGGGGGLRQSYPRTLSLLEATGITAMEAMYLFLESASFADYREIPYAGRGLCAEEAFYLFLARAEALSARNPMLRWSAQHEMLVAIHSLLTANPRPNFDVATPLIRCNASCWFAAVPYPALAVRGLGLRGGPSVEGAPTRVVYLYAATPDRFIHGPISPLIAELVALGTLAEIDTACSALVERYAVSDAEVADTAQQLAGRGLVR